MSKPPLLLQYHEESDMLVLLFGDEAYEAAGAVDTDDPDVVIHYDEQNRVREIEVEHASERLDLSLVRRSAAFEQIGQEVVDVKRIRADLGMTQAQFADYLSVPIGTLRGWELGRRQPRGPARRLLELSRDRPGLLFERPA